HERDLAVLGGDRRRAAKCHPELGLLCGAGAVGAEAMATHHHFVDALHVARSSRSIGGKRSALRRDARYDSATGRYGSGGATWEQSSAVVSTARSPDGTPRRSGSPADDHSGGDLHVSAVLLRDFPAARHGAQG